MIAFLRAHPLAAAALAVAALWFLRRRAEETAASDIAAHPTARRGVGHF